MEAKIFMTLSQLTKALLGVFLLGTVLGTIIGGLLFSKFKRYFKNSSKWG